MLIIIEERIGYSKDQVMEGTIMGKKIILSLLTGLWAVFYLGIAAAQHSGHDHGKPAPTTPQITQPGKQTEKQSVQSVTVEGLKVSLDVMSMGEHMKHLAASKGHSEGQHSQTHSLMVTMQDVFSKEIISMAKVQFVLQSPSGKKESGILEWSGDHFGGGFSPKGKGTYQVLLKIEAGGMEREAKFTYEAK